MVRARTQSIKNPHEVQLPPQCEPVPVVAPYAETLGVSPVAEIDAIINAAACVDTDNVDDSSQGQRPPTPKLTVTAENANEISIPSLDDVFASFPKLSLPITRFQEALEKDDISAFENLLTSNLVDVNSIDDKGTTLLMTACEKGRLEASRLLISNKAEVNYQRPSDGMTAMLCAAQSGVMPLMQMLKEHGGNGKQKKKNGATALMLCAKGGFEEAAKWCVDEGIDVNDITLNGVSALMLAVQEGHGAMVRLLVSRGAKCNISTEDGISPIMLAAQNGFLEVVKELMDHVANVDSRNNNGMNALLYAAKEGHLPIIEMLLAFGADIEASTTSQVTALMLACMHGHLSIVQSLVRARCQIDAQEKNGYTALAIACKQNHEEIVSFLLGNGANADIILGDGRTAPDLAKTLKMKHLFVQKGTSDPLAKKEVC